jgi:glycosyltransferase involved in cell wall biosynthesis
MCSYYEGGPASVPESLATGTPVFSNNIGMSTDLIKDGFNGYLLSMKPHNDVILFNQILNKGGLLNQLESGARESKNELITWEEVAHEHLSLYENCLK